MYISRVNANLIKIVEYCLCLTSLLSYIVTVSLLGE